MKVYLASRYQDFPLMQIWRDKLKIIGVLVTSRWINGGHEITEVNSDIERSRLANEDMEDIISADVVVVRSDPSFFRTGRGGRHVEFGIAIAIEKKIILVGERENVFHWLPQITVVPSFEKLIEYLLEYEEA